MSSSASKLLTVVTMGITLAVGVSVFRTVTDEQLQAMEQCERACNLGAPLFSGHWEFIVPAFLFLLVLLAVTSLTAGWPFGGQMR